MEDGDSNDLRDNPLPLIPSDSWLPQISWIANPHIITRLNHQQDWNPSPQLPSVTSIKWLQFGLLWIHFAVSHAAAGVLGRTDSHHFHFGFTPKFGSPIKWLKRENCNKRLIILYYLINWLKERNQKKQTHPNRRIIAEKKKRIHWGACEKWIETLLYRWKYSGVGEGSL